MDGQQDTKKGQKKLQRERAIRESSREDGHLSLIKVTQQLLDPFSQNDKQRQGTACPKKSLAKDLVLHFVLISTINHSYSTFYVPVRILLAVYEDDL